MDTLQHDFDNIANSLVNGQFDQAYRQMTHIPTEYLVAMLDYFAFDLADERLALQAAKIYFTKQKAR